MTWKEWGGEAHTGHALLIAPDVSPPPYLKHRQVLFLFSLCCMLLLGRCHILLCLPILPHQQQKHQAGRQKHQAKAANPLMQDYIAEAQGACRLWLSADVTLQMMLHCAVYAEIASQLFMARFVVAHCVM